MIVVFGTVCLDRIRRVPVLPGPGSYVEIQSEIELLGGEAANTAFALKEWGDAIRLAGNTPGNDPAGLTIRQRLSEQQLTLEELGLPNEMTPFCDIYVTPDGERTMFGRGFSDAGNTIDISTLHLENNGWFTADPNFGDCARSAAHHAKASGMNLYLMDFNEEVEPLGAGDVWQSSTDWIGKRGDVHVNLAVVKERASRSGAIAVLTDGPHGLCYCEPGERATFVQGFVAPESVDFTGAGDRFRAGMLHGLNQGWPLRKSLLFGSAAGCLKCGSWGGTGFVNTEEEVLSFLRQYGSV